MLLAVYLRCYEPFSAQEEGFYFVLSTIEYRRQQDYERYRLYSMDQLLEDEATFAGENLKTHNVNTVSYERDKNGLYVEAKQSDGSIKKLYLRAMADDGVEKYAESAALNPSLNWQRERCEQEKAHVDFAETMSPNSLYIVMSDCPQKELEAHGESVFGYNLERKLGFLQFFHVDQDNRLTVYSHSIEGNDQDGIGGIYQRFGMEYNESVRALSQPIYLEDVAGIDPQFELESTIASYDYEQYKKDDIERFAGIPRELLREEGNAFVRKQEDLLKEHCERVLFAGPHTDKANEYRYDFAVAIRKRFDGEIDQASYIDAGSELSGGGESGRHSGETVDACGNSLSSVVSEIASQGFSFAKRGELESAKKGQCRACLAEGIVGACSVCLDCQKDNDNGVDLQKRREVNIKKLERSQSGLFPFEQKHTTSSKVEIKKEVFVKRRYGQYAVLLTKPVLGGVTYQVYDTRTKQQLDENLTVTQKDLMLAA